MSTPLTHPTSFTLRDLRQAYSAAGEQAPALAGRIMADIRQRSEALRDHNIWIHLLSEREVAPYIDALVGRDPATLPLYGVPFAIKDNIDLAGIPTTAACPAYAYTPENSATVVKQLIAAGAVPVGKTNLDQFATGLVGTRSPWGPGKNSFHPEMVSGGSSAGSSLAVALGLASFSLGTDTAGSGRVPACFNNLVGLKPSIGLLSSTGMLPACRSLDCISIFALNCDDANEVLAVAEGQDDSDAYSRANPFSNRARHYGQQQGGLTLGVMPPEQLEFFGHGGYADAYKASLERIAEAGITLVEVDMSAFVEAARLLYEGPWVTERYIATRSIIEQRPEQMHEVTRAIISGGATPSAIDAFTAQYRLKALRQMAQKVLDSVDALLTPTAGRPYSIAELEADPITLNSNLGYYTNYMNLFDLAGLAVPTGFADHNGMAMPFGLTLVGEAFSDRWLLSIGNRLQQIFQLPLGKHLADYQPLVESPAAVLQRVSVVVCGAHLSGQPLNWQLTERGARLEAATHSAPEYQLYALAGGPPFRPGMVVAPEGEGRAIEVEVWSMPMAEFGSFVAGIPAPLGIGKVRLADGREVCGFICEGAGLAGAEDISHFGGWRAYLAAKTG
ncbi:allophanate hydrolase [Spongiibacter sp. KMU-166]|uniref:Allophanate hydrolase n=1 Tax=Spongiibacter thalassae TaxID=2721624 RepID=A0ABX1GBG0_9GAMM|nr:allophanate hydrolase [Spongiibacter thalassae]NKI16261.1 allophanate hydrolase [Spongiibacter thalassae]